METLYLLKVLLQTTNRSLIDFLADKPVSKDFATGVLLRAIMDDNEFVMRQEKPCPAICFESLRLYSDGKLYSLWKGAVVATLDAKAMEYIENAMIDRANREASKHYTQMQKVKTLINTTKQRSPIR